MLAVAAPPAPKQAAGSEASGNGNAPRVAPFTFNTNRLANIASAYLTYELIALVKGTDSGADVDDVTRARIGELVDELERRYSESKADPRVDPALVGDYKVVFTSSPQAAGGRFRSKLGRALFRTHALYQNVLPNGEVANRVEFALAGGIPGAVGLQGPFRPVDPVKVAPSEGVVEGVGKKVGTAPVAREFGGAVEVAFEPPYFEVAGTRFGLGGPSTVRLATTYLDKSIRLGRGGFGSLFIFEKMAPGAQEESQLPCAPPLRAAGAVLATAGITLFYALSAAMTVQRLVKRTLTTPAAGVPAAVAAAALAFAAYCVAAPPTLPVGALLALSAVHLAAVGILTGATVWVTFGQGDILFRSMGRHAFAELRAALRPRFLGFSTIVGAVALAAFAPSAAAAAAPQQVNLLAIALFGVMGNLLWAEPLGTQLGAYRNKLEAEQGIGKEVGMAPEEAKLTPALRRLNSRVGRWRAASGILTIATLGGLAMHGMHLAARLTFA